MPLARHALYAQNLEIYVAPTWDCGDTWLASMNHIAREGGCWVISTATALQGADAPLHNEKGALYAVIDTEAARNARKSLDVAGHYGRPDIFRLEIDRRPM